jgi:hypothetical protein
MKNIVSKTGGWSEAALMTSKPVVATQCRDRIEQPPAMADSRNA